MVETKTMCIRMEKKKKSAIENVDKPITKYFYTFLF